MSFSLSESVWDRSGSSLLSKNVFVLMFTFWTTIGIGASAWAAYMSLDWVTALQAGGWGTQIIFLLGVLFITTIGIFVTLGSSFALVSLIGYMMVAIPMGAISGPFVAMYTTASVVNVLVVTTGMVIVLGTIGTIFPQSLEGFGAWLFGGLSILFLGMLIEPIAGAFGLPVKGALSVIDWVSVVIFSGYVVFDLNRAMRVPRTHDNAIDCALGIYLDFINLFLHLLRIMGNTKSDD